MQPSTDNIPKEILDMLRMGDVMDMTERIAEAHGLLPQYYGALYRATRGVLLGKLPPNRFMPALEEDIGGDHDELVRIAQEINRDIFNPVKERLKELHGVGEKEGASDEAPSSSLVPPSQPSAPLAASPAAVSAPLPSPRPVMPKIAESTQKTPNNLESRLGGAFAIRKDPLITRAVEATQPAAAIPPPLPSAPAITAQPPTRTAPSTANPIEKLGLAPAAKPTPIAAAAPAQQTPEKTADPYREAL